MSNTVTIVIPTYNYAHTLPKAVTSAVGQLSAPCEILIVDDGSTDNTREVIEKLKADYPESNICAIKQENGGPSKARNSGINAASGAYLLLLDADDELLPNAITNLLKPIENNPEIDLVIGASIAVSSSGREKPHTSARPKTSHGSNFDHFMNKRASLSHGRFLVRRSLIQRIPYPEHIRGTEDLVVYAHLFALAKIDYIDKAVVKIHHHADSLRHNSTNARENGLAIVDLIFSDKILPPTYMHYRKPYISRRCLSIFRTLYRAGDYHHAETYYKKAIANEWRSLFKLTYLKKYLKMKLFPKQIKN